MLIYSSVFLGEAQGIEQEYKLKMGGEYGRNI